MYIRIKLGRFITTARRPISSGARRTVPALSALFQTPSQCCSFGPRPCLPLFFLIVLEKCMFPEFIIQLIISNAGSVNTPSNCNL